MACISSKLSVIRKEKGTGQNKYANRTGLQQTWWCKITLGKIGPWTPEPLGKNWEHASNTVRLQVKKRKRRSIKFLALSFLSPANDIENSKGSGETVSSLHLNCLLLHHVKGNYIQLYIVFGETIVASSLLRSDRQTHSSEFPFPNQAYKPKLAGNHFDETAGRWMPSLLDTLEVSTTMRHKTLKVMPFSLSSKNMWH